MLMTYARSELGRRRKQTIVVAVGLAIAVALLMVVNSVSAGVSNAQSEVLESVYGVGTDITVTERSEGPGNQEFGVNPDQGSSDSEGNTEFSASSLQTTQGTQAFDDSTLSTVRSVDGVADATAVLTLQQMDLGGSFAPGSQSTDGTDTSDSASATPSAGSTDAPEPPAGDSGGGFGGGNFSLNSTTVTGVQVGATLGNLSTLTLSDGRMFEEGDDGEDVALISATYADNNELAVGSSVTVGDSDVEVVGIVDSSASSISDIYLPLATAQTLADMEGQITSIYVQASDSSQVTSVSETLTQALPEAIISTDQTLAESVTGSLSSASSLVGSLGLWLSIAVLVVAFGLAVLFTVSGVNQRIRDFGTLKAIGWSNKRVVGQVAVESMLRAAIGAIAGVVLGLITIIVLNLMGITLSGSTGGFSMQGGGGGGGGSAPSDLPSGMGEAVNSASNAVDVVLHSPVSIELILIGVGAALVGGLLAGIIGGWRAAKLRPAEALRSVN